MDLLADLTPAQRAAVTHVDGPLLVVAGAGSGKTRVITRRVAYLVEQGIPARNVLAITFTNKAAGEMRHRISSLLGEERGRGATVSTFHSLCARLLRRFADRVGFESNFVILDESDQRAAIREALIEVAADPKLFAPPKIGYAISRAKDRVETPADLAARAASRFEVVAAKAFEVYANLLKQRNAFDFDDLQLKVVELLRKHDDVREQLQDRFRYVLVDEYQDTSHAQYEIAKRLTEKHRNLNATGDPDQSIYGWRGADVENILRFEKDYPDCKVVLLENNYRSTKVVCRAANELIKHNKRRKEKVLVTPNDEGQPIEYFEADDEFVEARHVASRIEGLVHTGTDPEAIAVFYRTNSLSRAIEQSLFERNVPYHVVGALSFYDRKEVKDVLSYLRVLANPRDDMSAMRLLQVPPRGIGKTTLQKLKAFATENGTSLAGAIGYSSGIEGLPRKAREALVLVEGLLDRLRARMADASAEALVRGVVEETNYLAYLAAEYPDEDERAANIEALVAGAREFDLRAQAEVRERPKPVGPPRELLAPRQPAAVMPAVAPPKKPSKKKAKDPGPQIGLFAEPQSDPELEPVAPVAPMHGQGVAPSLDDLDVLPPIEPGLHGFLEQIALVSEQEAREAEKTEGKVSLMTVHTAKGLEFDHVFLVGLEDGLFPNARALEERDGLEEERRLAYVAITRARKRLYVSRANARSRFGRSSDFRPPSGFLFEMPDDVFEAGKSPRNLAPYARGASAKAWDSDDADDSFAGANYARSHSARDEGDPELADVESQEERPNRLWSRKVAPTPAAAPASKSGAVKSGEAARKLLAEVGEKARAATATTADDLKAGERVRHEHFGIGRVLEVSGAGLAKRVKVLFVEFGEKNLVLQYARLSKVPS